MPDHLHLSLRLRGFDQTNMFGHLEKVLSVFPFSRLRPGISALRVYALEFAEPALLEREFPAETDLDEVIAAAAEVEHPDCAYLVEGWWDLWKYHGGDWKLGPSPVSIACFGPEFENEVGDHVRIDLGPELAFVPQPGAPVATRRAQSNLQSVVRLARDIERAAPIERRNLWSESGENFADLVDAAFSE